MMLLEEGYCLNSYGSLSTAVFDVSTGGKVGKAKDDFTLENI